MPRNSAKQEEQVRRKRRSIANNMGAGGNMLKGSLIERFTVCRRAGCHCMKGKKHGPYLYASVFDGKQSRQVYVPQSMHTEVRKWVQNAQKIGEIIGKVSNLSVKLIRLKHSGVSGKATSRRSVNRKVRQ